MSMREWRLNCSSHWGQHALLSEHVYCVAVAFRMTKYSTESASNFVLSLNIPPQKLFRFRRPQLWATGDWQLHHDNLPTHAHVSHIFLVQHQIIQVNQPPHSPDLVPCDFWLFPKWKSPLKGKRFQTLDEIQENMTRQLTVTGRTVGGPRVSTLQGTEVSLSYEQCFLYLVPSLINVSIFHITWLDIFWTDLVHWIFKKISNLKSFLAWGLCNVIFPRPSFWKFLTSGNTFVLIIS